MFFFQISLVHVARDKKYVAKQNDIDCEYILKRANINKRKASPAG